MTPSLGSRNLGSVPILLLRVLGHIQIWSFGLESEFVAVGLQEEHAIGLELPVEFRVVVILAKAVPVDLFRGLPRRKVAGLILVRPDHANWMQKPYSWMWFPGRVATEQVGHETECW